MHIYIVLVTVSNCFHTFQLLEHFSNYFAVSRSSFNCRIIFHQGNEGHTEHSWFGSIINRMKMNNFHAYGSFHILKYVLKLDSQKLPYWIKRNGHCDGSRYILSDHFWQGILISCHKYPLTLQSFSKQLILFTLSNASHHPLYQPTVASLLSRILLVKSLFRTTWIVHRHPKHLTSVQESLYKLYLGLPFSPQGTFLWKSMPTTQWTNVF